MDATNNWCVVGYMTITKWQGGWNTVKEKMLWKTVPRNQVMCFNAIYYDFNEDEAHAMCKLFNQGETK